MALIGINAKTRGGKDLVGNIIQYLTHCKSDNTTWEEWITLKHTKMCDWQIHKYADKLKDIVCLLIGCTREQLEDQKFKETELGEEWRVWEINSEWGYRIFGSFEDFNSYLKQIEDDGDCIVSNYRNYILTPRLLLQLLGTQCGRMIIHPNIWVNATMADYKEKTIIVGTQPIVESIHLEKKYPDWIITDCRFENEAKAIKDRKGIIIRIERPIQFRFPKEWEEFEESGYSDFYHYIGEKNSKMYQMLTHESETGLDNYKHFDYIINNQSNKIEDLIEEVKQILIKEGIIG